MNIQPEQDINSNNKNGKLIASATRYSGPLPPPNMLAEFEKIVPGSASKIIEMSVQQSTHRREMEKMVISSDIANSKRGQWMGFLIAICSLVVSGFLINNGHNLQGGLLGGGTLTALVAVFAYGSWSRERERNLNK